MHLKKTGLYIRMYTDQNMNVADAVVTFSTRLVVVLVYSTFVWHHVSLQFRLKHKGQSDAARGSLWRFVEVTIAGQFTGIDKKKKIHSQICTSITSCWKLSWHIQLSHWAACSQHHYLVNYFSADGVLSLDPSKILNRPVWLWQWLALKCCVDCV